MHGYWHLDVLTVLHLQSDYVLIQNHVKIGVPKTGTGWAQQSVFEWKMLEAAQ